MRGPRIAILTAPSMRTGFQGNRANFRDLIVAGRRHGAQVFVVTTQALRQGLRLVAVSGYSYDFKRRRWVHGSFGMPSVIYNRIPTRKAERRPNVTSLIKELQRNSGIPCFNPHFFNKEQLHEWLQADSDLRQHLPHTEPLVHEQSLRKLCNRYGALMLKPVNGKAGAGMMKITRSAGRGWLLERQWNRRLIRRPFTSWRLLWNVIKKHMTGKRYVAQQWIDCLKSAGGSPFDLRLLLQKNERGQWSLTGTGARVAGRGRFTTHVPRGGSIASPLNLVRSAFGERRGRHILTETERLALRIARELEKRSGQTVGEMSMDIGLDQVGKAWFFEANARPMKFDEPLIRRRSLRKWVQYCRYLAAR